jgi:hypothetical protein
MLCGSTISKMCLAAASSVCTNRGTYRKCMCIWAIMHRTLAASNTEGLAPPPSPLSDAHMLPPAVPSRALCVP